MNEAELFLGRAADGADVRYDPANLTTHGVIVGMTGSGKTGLGVVLLEEVLRSGVPCLVLDPKGDMGNLLLGFPALAGADFAPWVDEGEARRRGLTPAELGEETAARWRDGLSEWGLGPPQIQALRERIDFGIYTPGSRAAVPLNVLGSLRAPREFADEGLLDEVEALVVGLLGLIGVDADPLTSREQILLTQLVERAWRGGQDLDLATLIHQVQSPPLRKLGVFELDAFFPPKDRLALAMRLNALLANPSFAPWLEGEPLDVERLLWTAEGKPRASVLYLAHLSAEERQFVVTLVLSKVASWMQTQAGTSDLRALVYMDEVYGFCPPTAMPPAKKPILTLLKQARAFGVGLVLATQNPVDLDYKALSNAGTWWIGRLQTERDQLRLADALASGGMAGSALGALLAGLQPRQFLLHTTRGDGPRVFSSRWALSFLSGPLTKAQLGALVDAGQRASVGSDGLDHPPAATPAPAPPPTSAQPTPQASLLAPHVADGIPVYTLAPSAPWAAAVGAHPGCARHEAAVVARVSLLFDERSPKLEHREDYECVWFPLSETCLPAEASAVDYDPRDLEEGLPAGATFEAPPAPIERKGWWRDLERDLREHVLGARRLEVFHNPALKLVGRAGESRDDFAVRCEAAADERADEDAARLRGRFEARVAAAQRALAKAESALARAESARDRAESQATLRGLDSVLGVFLGGRGGARGMARRAARGARGWSAAQGQRARGADRVSAAEEAVYDKVGRLADLEQELQGALSEIDARWTGAAAGIEALVVGLEKRDVRVEQVALVWVPRRAPQA